MPVKLSRFVRVMSGGRIVTDELVGVREAKVNDALDLVQAEIDRLGAAGLRIPALSDRLRTLTADRDAALRAGSNKEVCEALEDVKFDARDAARDAATEVDAALLVAQAKADRLGDVDAALVTLRRAEAAITAPACKGPVTASIVPLQRRRDALAGASELATVTTQVGLAPALVADIGAATRAAAQAGRDAAAFDKAVQDVNAALAAVVHKQAAIPVAAYKSPLTAAIQPLAARRDSLVGAADPGAVATQVGLAPALLNDIGTVRVRVDQADLDARAYTTAKADVTLALGALRLAEAAISVPAYKGPITALVGPLAIRADALTGAADAGAMATQVGLAPALLADLGNAEGRANTAKVAAEQFLTRTAAIDSSIANSSGWIGILKAGTDTQLKLDRDKLLADRAALDTTAPAAMNAALTAIEVAMNKLYTDATTASANQNKTNADTWPPAFAGWKNRIGKITAHNPVDAEVAALLQEKANAEAVVEPGARSNALNGFIAHAAALQTKVQGMERAKKEVEQVGMTIVALLTMKPPPIPGPDTLALERLNELAKMPAAFNQTTTDLVMAQLGALKVAMATIKGKAEDWRAAQLGLVKQKASVAQSLAEARVAVDALADGDPKTQLDAELKALVLRKTATDTMAEAAANKALFALGKDALALLERAHKEAFTAQLATPDGKTKIDDLIKALGDTAADPQAEAKCRAALAARFKLQVDVLEGLSVERLPQLYAMFALVPEAHVGHDKLTKLEYNTDASLSASYYQGADNKIVLWMPGAETDAPYQPQDGVGAVENLNYFKATALHEIGHAVDTKQGIMSDSRMAGPDLGGWKKETVETVAAAYYTNAFASFVAPSGPTEADLRSFIKSVLETGDCAKPASAGVALGSLFAKWDEIYASAGCANCKKIRNADLSPWDHPVPVGDRAYHEGYGGSWFSYLVSARSKGVSNYQWRAPPEWFAELYVYHHMTKKDVPASVKGYIMGTKTAS